MSLNNDEIADNVSTIVGAYIKQAKGKLSPEEEKVITAAVELLTNILQNLNDIAFCARKYNR
jgi:hypothetical protein